MLLEFKVGGFCSFKEFQELNLTPFPKSKIKNTKYEDNYYISKKNRVMKSAIIFGANASGKTNLVMAMEEFLFIVKNGINLPLGFDKEKLNHDSQAIEFEITLMSKNESIFNYYIKYNNENIIEERLEHDEKLIYEFKNNILVSELRKITTDMQKVFSNKTTDILLKKLKDFEIEEIKSFLENINNISVAKSLYIDVGAKDVVGNIYESGKKVFEDNEEEVIEILKIIDSTILGFEFEKLGEKNNQIIYNILFTRCNSIEKYGLGNESEGIKKIVFLMELILGIYNDKIIIIDELDSSISTKSLIQIYNSIVNSNKNAKGQLIVTSHNIFLFNNNIFDPQQIYIVNKKKDLNSEIYSLGEFKIRTEKEQLYQDYLKGKFGGVNG